MLLSIVGEHLFALLFHRSPFIASLLIAQPVIKSLAMERLKILVNILIIPIILLPVPLLLMWMWMLISFQQVESAKQVQLKIALLCFVQDYMFFLAANCCFCCSLCQCQ